MPLNRGPCGCVRDCLARRTLHPPTQILRTNPNLWGWILNVYYSSLLKGPIVISWAGGALSRSVRFCNRGLTRLLVGLVVAAGCLADGGESGWWAASAQTVGSTVGWNNFGEEWNSADPAAMIANKGLEANEAAILAASLSGDPRAQTLRALGLMRGVWGNRNIEEAVALLEKAASAGEHTAAFVQAGYVIATKDKAGLGPTILARLEASAQAGQRGAMVLLGGMLVEGLGVPKDIARGLALSVRAADAGEVQAMLNLGTMFEAGRFVPKNLQASAMWYRRASEAGSPEGMAQYGEVLEYGLGAPKNIPAAISLYRRAAEAGDRSAMENLAYALSNGVGIARDPVQSLHWYKRAAELGSDMAMNNIGIAYASGVGVQKDQAEAARWYLAGANAGSAYAKENAAMYLYNGWSIAKDIPLAARFWREAGEQGRADGAFNYAACLFFGHGVAQDRPQAVVWYKKAIALGHVKAMSDLGGIYLRGDGVPPNPAEAFRLYYKAAHSDDTIGMFNLGYTYDVGAGTPANKAEAARWYALAAERGHATAAKNLALLRARPKPVATASRGAAPGMFDVRAAEMRYRSSGSFPGIVDEKIDYNAGVVYKTMMGVAMNYYHQISVPKCTRQSDASFICAYQRTEWNSFQPQSSARTHQVSNTFVFRDGYWDSPTLKAQRAEYQRTHVSAYKQQKADEEARRRITCPTGGVSRHDTMC